MIKLKKKYSIREQAIFDHISEVIYGILKHRISNYKTSISALACHVPKKLRLSFYNDKDTVNNIIPLLEDKFYIHYADCFCNILVFENKSR